MIVSEQQGIEKIRQFQVSAVRDQRKTEWVPDDPPQRQADGVIQVIHTPSGRAQLVRAWDATRHQWMPWRHV